MFQRDERDAERADVRNLAVKILGSMASAACNEGRFSRVVAVSPLAHRFD